MITLRNFRKDAYRALLEPGYAVNTLFKRIGAYLCYKFNLERGFFPESVTFFLTRRCNLKCKMCGQLKASGGAGELAMEELQKAVDDVALFRPNITLYGGEPFLYSGIGPLIKYIKSRKLHLTIITNGTFLDRYAGVLVDNGVDIVSVSIDGPAGVHDLIRGMDGSFAAIEKGIKSVNELKKSSGNRKPIINIVFTISSFNYRHMSDMTGIAKGLGADTLNFHHLIFMNKDSARRQNESSGKTFGEISKDWEGFILNEPGDIDTSVLIEEINKVRKTKAPFLINFYPNLTDNEIRRYYSSPEFLPESYDKRCLGPWMTAYVYPDGSVKPCLAFDCSAGNIKQAGFADIWQGDGFRKFRAAIRKEKIFPVCERCTELYRY